jgi:hypothetical protein
MEAAISTATYDAVSQAIALNPHEGPITRTKVFQLLLEDVTAGDIVTVVRPPYN